jgi:SDR family mycofactocin-dependent oxidoreductase
MGEHTGKVALITGGARGQGRSHALTLAAEGADIVLVDICGPVEGMPQIPASREDLDETVRLVEELGVKCIGIEADVRRMDQMDAAAREALAHFGRIDILLANAGIMRMERFDSMSAEDFQVQVDVLLIGVANSIRAVLPTMQAQGYGRIVATGSGASLGGIGNLAPYTAAKWGIVGLCKSIALEVAKQGINVNVIAPFTVNTMLNWNENVYAHMRPDLENPTKEQAIEALRSLNELPIDYLEPIDVSHAVAFLVSEKARYVSGTVFDVMAGFNAHNLA